MCIYNECSQAIANHMLDVDFQGVSGEGFIQKFLFGVEGGVTLSCTVAPHEVLHNVLLYI